MDMAGLTENDLQYIRMVVKEVMRESNQIGALFSSPLDFTEEEGRIKFKYPAWMIDIKNYLSPIYGEREVQNLMLDLMTELMKQDGLPKLLSSPPELSAVSC